MTDERSRCIRLPGAIVLVWVVAAAMIATATAGRAEAQPSRFVYELCDSAVPGGDPPAIEFHTEPGAAFAPFDTCSSPGGSIGVSETGQVTQAAGRLEVAVPATPGGYVEGETISGFASNLQPGNEGSHVYVDGWPVNGQAEARFFQIRSGPSNLIGVGNGGSFDIALDCSASPCNPGGVIGASHIAVDEVDPVPPVVGPPRGSVLSGVVLRGHQTLSAEATDVGGGVSAMEVRVNGMQVPGAIPGACSIARVAGPSYEGIAATSPSPCPPTLAGSWTLDTAAAPFQEGANGLQVCASDLATTGAPNTTCSAPQTVEVNNSCIESPTPGGQVLNASFVGAGTEAVTVGFGKEAEVTGSLADQAGDPISGATICVQSQAAGTETPPTPIATATTGVNGEFTYKVAPGPNRRLLVGYRHDSFQIARTLALDTHTRPSLRLNAGRIDAGGSVKVTGNLPGPAAAGRVLVLQASALHGRRWLTFRRVTTGPQGGFRATYRFGHTRHTLTYRLRASVPRQAGYEYEPGVSKPARVKVRGNRRITRN
jgi:hypothetical protein